MKSSRLFRTTLLTLLLSAAPNLAAAAWYKPWTWGSAVASGLVNIAGGLIGWVAFFVNYIMSLILGVFIAVVTYVIGVVLQLNDNVMNTLAVQSGFQVTLAIANLGFVMGIIIIAIATILRRETYGIKKTLWKLVVAAIMVNFSLVIGGVFINFAGRLTSTFMEALPGGGGGLGAYSNFASNLAGAFAPHRSILVGFSTTGGGGGSVFSGSTDSSNFGGSLASVITPIASVIFTFVMLLVIFIVLCVFLFMLI